MVVGDKDKRGQKQEKEGRGFGRLPSSFPSFLFVDCSHDCLIWVIFFGTNLVPFLDNSNGFEF